MLTIVGIIAAGMIASATIATNQDVIAKHNNGHDPPDPPACDNGNEKVKEKNKHCEEGGIGGGDIV